MSEILGRLTCHQGGRAVITQTKRKGAHFMIRCECCGFNQSTGKAHQQWIWNNAEWLAETPPHPVNVEPTAKAAPAGEPEPNAQTETATDFDPETELNDTEPASQTQPKNRGVLALAAVGLAGFIAAIASA